MKTIAKIWIVLLCLTALALLTVGIGALAFGIRSGVLPVTAGVVLSVIMCLRPAVRSKLPRFYRHASRVFTALCALVILICVIASAQILSCYFDEDAPRGSVMVVLGCGLSPIDHTTPSLMLSGRLNAAARYLESHPDTLCVLSGGQGPDERVSEAQSMYDYLTSRGIDGARLLREDKSRSTRENLSFSVDVITQSGYAAPESVIIVTDGFHEYRAHHIAGELGLDAYTVSSQAPFGLTAYFWMREIAGVVLQTWM